MPSLAFRLTPGQGFPFELEAPAGIAADLTFRIEDDDDVVVLASSGVGIVEFAAGNYRRTATAPEEAGFYTAVWTRVSTGLEAAEQFEVTYTLSDEPSWAPSTADIAVHVRDRVLTAGGIPVTDFTENTNPSLEQVERLRRLSVDDVVNIVGTLESCTADNISDLRESAGSLAAVRTAMRIERTHFPNEIRGEASNYTALMAEWEEGKATLAEAVAESCGGSADGGSSVGPSVLAADTFPTEPDPIGYGSVW